MRDQRFVALHRGGNLSTDEHIKLMRWAISCFERVLDYYGTELDGPINRAIIIAEGWCTGAYTTADAINSSRAVHSLAKGISYPVSQAVARSVGQAVATAHMADHCVGAALYAQRVLKLIKGSYEDERRWQVIQLNGLPNDLLELVKVILAVKARGLGLWY